MTSHKKQERTTFHIEANVEDRQLYRTLHNFIELDRTLYDLPNLIGLYRTGLYRLFWTLENFIDLYMTV